MKKSKVEALLYAMLILAVAISVANVFILQGRVAKTDEARGVANEFLRPAKLEVTKILLSDCEKCFDIEGALESIKKQNVNITKEKTLLLDESEAEELIGKFDIQKIPTLIISGEVNKTQQLKSFFEKIGDFPDEYHAVFTSINPPYYDVPSAKVVGEVSVIDIVDSSCKECVPLTQVISALEQAGVAVTDEKTYEYFSKEGIELINKFNISRIPAILVSNEVNHYDDVKEQVQQLADEKQGFYALHATLPPYRDLEQGKVVGLAKLVFLTDNSCAGCYNVKINEQILARLGVFVKESTSYDISSSEGKALISEYKIEKAPVILVSPEASVYPVFLQAWNSVGSVEDDGWHVMRKPENLGAYRDMKTNEVVQIGNR